jgi:crotonobetainyl-CoA:carnitine CoA-transferase CaiB-like acyl-CoA transferase
VTFEDIKKINPLIIYGELTGFGEKSDRVAYDLVLQAETGFMSINGQAGDLPLKLPIAFIDLFAAHQLKEGILVALLKRGFQAQAFRVSVSLFDAAVSSLANQGSNYLNTGIIPVQSGSLHPNIAPYGEIFYSKDNIPFVLAVGSQEQFNKLCSLLGLENLSQDPNYSENQSRIKNRKSLEDLLANVFRKENFETWANRFAEAKIPYGRIKNIQEVLESPLSKHLLTKSVYGNETYTRVKTNVFTISC